jgi:hypothetical protein
MLQRLFFAAISLIFLLSVVGNYPVFQLKQWVIHQKIAILLKESFLKEDLQIVVSSSKHPQALRWEREGKEFWYKNNLYDVVFFEKNDTATTYYCLQDAEETELTQHFYATIQANNDAETSPFGHFLKKNLLLYFPTYIYVPSDDALWSRVAPEKNEVLPKRSVQCISQFFNQIDPPPKS